MKIKYTLFLSISLLFVSFNFAQTTGGEIVISEESIQRLANKLYALKEKLNSSKNQSPTFEEKQIQLKAYENILDLDIENRDTLIYILEQMLKAEELNENKPTKYTIIEQYVEDTLAVSKNPFNSETSQYSKTQKESYTNEEKKSTSIESNADTKEILKRLTAIESQLNALKQQESAPIIIEREAANTKEGVIINNRKDKNTPIILATQIKQNQALKETNAKLDSVLKVINSPRNATLQTTDTISKKAMAVAHNNPSMESLRNQIYLISAKLDKVLEDKIEADAVQKVENATSLTDTIHEGNTNKGTALEEAYKVRKNKYGNYFEQIFFANNSTKVEEKYQNLISNLVQQLKSEPKIDVSIAGFASKTGNESYNQQISMQRALAMKKKLMQEGIPPQRILTDYRGIDYEANTLAEARRLDIEFVVRK